MPEKIDDVELAYFQQLQIKAQAFIEFLTAKYRLPSGSSIDPTTGEIKRPTT